MARRDDRYARKREVVTTSHVQLHAMTSATDHSATAHRLFYSDASGNIQELAHGASTEVLTSNGASAAPSWAAASGGLADVVDDLTPQLGGPLDVNGSSLVSTANGDITLAPNGTGNIVLGTMTIDADQTVGAGQDNYVLTYDNGTGLVSLEAAAGGSSLTAWIDNGLAGEGLYDSSVVLRTTSSGIDIADVTGGDPVLGLYEDGTWGTRRAFIQMNNVTGLYIDSELISADVHIRGRDSTGAVSNLLIGDPNAEVQLYYDNVQVFETVSNGVAAISTSSIPSFYMRDSAGGANRASFQAWSDDVFYMTNSTAGGDINIRVRNVADTSNETAILCESDGAVSLYYNGNLSLSTTANGIQVENNSGSGNTVLEIKGNTTTNPSINMEVDATTKAQIQYKNDGTDVWNFRLVDTGDIFSFTNDADGTLLQMTGAGSVDLYYAGTKEAGTKSGGFHVENFLSMGDLSELTIATGAVTATGSFHAIDTEADASTDDLDTITFSGQTGTMLVIEAANGTRTVVCKDGTGNLRLAGDFSLTAGSDKLTLIWNGTVWHELSRSDNGT